MKEFWNVEGNRTLSGWWAQYGIIIERKKNTVLAAIIISWLLNSFIFSADNQGKLIDCNGSYGNIDA